MAPSLTTEARVPDPTPRLRVSPRELLPGDRLVYLESPVFGGHISGTVVRVEPAGQWGYSVLVDGRDGVHYVDYADTVEVERA